MGKVTIYCGVPGSGKTTLATKLHADATVCSADSYFITDNGEYLFNPALLGEAHALCLRRFMAAVAWRDDAIVVDNTNTSLVEMAPYVAIAQAYHYELDIVTVLCAPGKAHARNTHGVPLDRVETMHKALRSREIPPWWPHREVLAD